MGQTIYNRRLILYLRTEKKHWYFIYIYSFLITIPILWPYGVIQYFLYEQKTKKAFSWMPFFLFFVEKNNNYNVVFRYFVLFLNTFNPPPLRTKYRKTKKKNRKPFFSFSFRQHAFGPGFSAPRLWEDIPQERTRKQIEK